MPTIRQAPGHDEGRARPSPAFVDLVCSERAYGSNVPSSPVLGINSDLIAFAMLTYAYSTESVNGVPGQKVPGAVFTLPAPAGPEHTFEP